LVLRHVIGPALLVERRLHLVIDPLSLSQTLPSEIDVNHLAVVIDLPGESRPGI